MGRNGRSYASSSPLGGDREGRRNIFAESGSSNIRSIDFAGIHCSNIQEKSVHQQMESDKKREDSSSPSEIERKEDTVTPPDRNDACTSSPDPVEINTESGNGGAEDGISFIPLDVLAKGTPPPTSGDPSSGRNHVTGTVVTNDGAADRVVLFETLDKHTQPSSTGDSSRGRNTISTSSSIGFSMSNERTPDEGKESSAGSDGSNPNHQDNRGA